MVRATLILQTTYAELLDRCANAAFEEAFPEEGTFVSKTVSGRRYWYFQVSTANGRTQRYAGPETSALLDRIERHRQARHDERDRRSLVSTLVRSFGLPRPIPAVGDVVAALAKAGVFRLRSVLVGSAAFQTYAAMLGEKLPAAAMQTGDIDIAQFASTSKAVEDRTSPILEALQAVDGTFRAIPARHRRPGVVGFRANDGLRVEFLAPNEGADTDEPVVLPALSVDAQPLRFLDFLIYEPEPAVLLHKAGIYVLVPAPQRYAVHKLIVSERRAVGSGKADKDRHQAAALLRILAAQRPHDLADAWREAEERGSAWQELLHRGLERIDADLRAAIGRITGQ